MDVVVKEHEVKIPEKPILRHHQREELVAEIETIENQLNPYNTNSHIRKSGDDVVAATNRGKRLKEQLTRYSPPILSGAAKDKIAKRAKEIEEKVLSGMPTQEEMRKNPAGMVGRHMRWEKANKKAILEWKNAQQMLEPDSNDPDLSNFERLRPNGEMDQFRSNAQISGHMGYYNIPQELWDLWAKGQGPNSALKQVQQREAVEASEPAVKVDGRKRARTEEEKRAFAERMALARASKQGQSEPLSPQEGESVPFEGA